MSFRLGPEMMEEVAVSALMKGKCILLTKSTEQAEKLALKVRESIEAELTARPNNYTPVRGRPPALKASATNPTFVQITNGGWIFVWPADDMSAEEDLGQPQIVYWPSEGGLYEKVTFELWQKERRAGHIYRPVTIATPKKSEGRPTSWDRLLSDDEDE